MLGKGLAEGTQCWDTSWLPLGTQELWMDTATQLAMGIVHTQIVCFSSKLAVREGQCIIYVWGYAQRDGRKISKTLWMCIGGLTKVVR